MVWLYFGYLDTTSFLCDKIQIKILKQVIKYVYKWDVLKPLYPQL